MKLGYLFVFQYIFTFPTGLSIRNLSVYTIADPGGGGGGGKVVMPPHGL